MIEPTAARSKPIQAIETRYAGCRFRSRLEARWAVFFEHLSVKWEYEPEGYKLPSGYYLPDFLLPNIRERGTWFEVKPETTLTPSGKLPSDFRWAELTLATDKPLIIAFGLPAHNVAQLGRRMAVLEAGERASYTFADFFDRAQSRDALTAARSARF